jgi:hypothetical protein
MIYCYRCETLISSSQTHSEFRTGYYKVGVPLGVCKACKLKEEEAMYNQVQEEGFRGKKLVMMA